MSQENTAFNIKLSGPFDTERPLAIDLFCGLFGWSEGLIQEGWRSIGFDLEDMHANFGMHRPPHCHLVIQDVRTLHGSQFRNASLIVASPPCQAYSYRAMPWKRAKALPPPSNELFEACFRIQREACEAAGRHIPMIVENVRGAQKWVGQARWNYGSFYFWGDVPALMPIGGKYKTRGLNWSDRGKHGQDFTRVGGKAAMVDASASMHQLSRKDGVACGGLSETSLGRKGIPHRPTGYWTNPTEHGIKCGGDWFGPGVKSEMRKHSSKSRARKMASAMIAKIPPPVARHVARVFKEHQ